MRLRRFVLFLGLLGAVALVLLRLAGRREEEARVDVYLLDGTLVSFGEDDPGGALLLSLAREVRAC
jgi:hypothetical protein